MDGYSGSVGVSAAVRYAVCTPRRRYCVRRAAIGGGPVLRVRGGRA